MSEVQDAAAEAIAIRNVIISLCDRYPAQVAAHSTANPQQLSELRNTLAKCEIVIWKEDLFELAKRGSESFIGTSAPSYADGELPKLFHCWNFYLDVPSDVRAAWGLPSSCNVSDWVVVPDKRGLGVVYIIGAEGDPIPYFRPLAISGSIDSQEKAILVAQTRFLDLKLAAKEPVHLPRPVRRRMERENQSPPSISVIQLRQREHGASLDDCSREYHHRWIVKGHWRRLAEPRRSDGAEVTFINPYVKGPEGAPLLQPRESVYVVAR